MTTLAPDSLRWAAREIDYNMPEYPSAVLSGIAPDQAHLNGGGHHVSIEDLIRYGNAGDFSNRLPQDRTGPRNLSSAVDISMSTVDMVKNWNRWFRVWQDRAWDTRAKYFHAYNGWNGVGSAERLDFRAGTRTTASADHKWHNHRETHRQYAADMMAARAMVSIDRGETHDQWLRSIGQGGQSTVEDEIDMGVGTDKAKNADRYLWLGVTQLQDKVPGILGDDGKPVEVTNEFAKTLKAMAAGIATLVQRQGEMAAELKRQGEEIAALRAAQGK